MSAAYGYDTLRTFCPERKGYMEELQREIIEEKSEEERFASLPVYLQNALKDEEVLAQNAENQIAWRERFGAASPFLGQTPQTLIYLRATREVSDWQASRGQIQADLLAAHLRGDAAEVARLDERFRHFSTLLGESLAVLGQFELAARVHPNPREQARYLRLKRAVERDDDERCGIECERKFQASPHIITRERVEADVFSINHGRFMPAISCTSCGELNVRAPDAPLARARAARRRAQEVAGHLPKQHAPGVLQSAGLVPDKVFK